eukprot:scaffold1283_cov220-Chaetoceros_neogracile.AAC.4
MEVTEGASNSTGEVGRDLFKFFHGYPSYLSKSVEHQHPRSSFPGIRRIGNSPRWEQTAKAIVEVLNNGVDYTHSFHSFEFHRLYQPGFEDDTLTLCPNGVYCNRMSYRNFTLCPIGTYQPKYGEYTCRICDVGFVCPENGLPVPRLCPAGYVCDLKGTKRVDQLCPISSFAQLAQQQLSHFVVMKAIQVIALTHVYSSSHQQRIGNRMEWLTKLTPIVQPWVESLLASIHTQLNKVCFKIPTSHSASSNVLLRSDMMMNCAFLVLSLI